MPLPTWITQNVLAEAAIATAAARQTATNIHNRGGDHLHDPDWRRALAEAQRTGDKADEIGISRQDVLDASKAR